MGDFILLMRFPGLIPSFAFKMAGFLPLPLAMMGFIKRLLNPGDYCRPPIAGAMPYSPQKKLSVVKIAILGFGHAPPAYNLELATIAGERLAVHGHCVVVGNLLGTFAFAIESADANGGQTVAIVDQETAQQDRPASTEIEVVDSLQKHQRIAELADAGLVLGGAEGTRKLAAKLLAMNKPLVAVKGTGGAVDDQSLPNAVSIAESIDQALELLLTQLNCLGASGL